MKSPGERTVSIGEAARLTGVSIKQIRHWHAKGYIPAPERVICGERSYRWFDRDALKVISQMRSYLDEGFTVQAAAKKIKPNQ